MNIQGSIAESTELFKKILLCKSLQTGLVFDARLTEKVLRVMLFLIVKCDIFSGITADCFHGITVDKPDCMELYFGLQNNNVMYLCFKKHSQDPFHFLRCCYGK